MKVKKNTLYLLLLVIVVALAAFLFLKSPVQSTNKTLGENSNGEMQKIVISERNGNYYPPEIRVKAGAPVSISLDNNVVGCFRDFTIPDLNLRKYLATPQDSLVFTPKEKGTYTFACSMRMGVGKLIVE